MTASPLRGRVFGGYGGVSVTGGLLPDSCFLALSFVLDVGQGFACLFMPYMLP